VVTGATRVGRDVFPREVEPVLTPLGLDPARPFPRIQNKSLNFIVELAGQDAFGRGASLAIVQVPRSLPRLIQAPSDGATFDIVYLSQSSRRSSSSSSPACR
jgi:polyphosphate kinase